MATEKRPEEAYRTRLEAREAARAQWARRSGHLSNLRLLVFLLAALAAGAAWYGAASWLLVLGPAALFALLVAVHEMVVRRERRSALAVEHYQVALERVAGRLPQGAPPGLQFLPDRHPYARDLDLFGRGSLFQRLCTTPTQFGERRLAELLLTLPELEHTLALQASIRATLAQIELREDLYVLAPRIRGQVRPEALRDWAMAPAELVETRARWVARMLVFSGAAALGAAFLLGSLAPVFVGVVIGILAHMPHHRALSRLQQGIDAFSRALNAVAAILERVQQEPVTTDHLQALQARMKSGEHAAHEAIRALDRLAYLFGLQRNAMFAPFALMFGWGLRYGVKLEQWRVRHREPLQDWLDALGEFEAITALAAYAFERPEDTFPEFQESGAIMEAEAIGHPMLPADRCVRNSFLLGQSPQCLLVSGSNMSGKSTLLRTAGVSVVLARVGAPVRAERLRLSPLHLGATIHVQDSIQEGASRFYAEIRRFQDIFAIDPAKPVLFLCDEILHGTNSHDRLRGAAGLLKALLERGAIGMVTTHDLALTEMAGAYGERVRNVHFEDQHEGGKLCFDYRLRDGVVEHSNALELMRSLGLPV